MNIAIVTNILNPYRSAFFDECYAFCKQNGYGFKVYAMVGEKDDRPWKYEQFKREYTELLPSRTVKLKGIFFHFNPGYKKIIKQFAPDIVVMAGSYLQPTVVGLTRLAKKLGFKAFFWSESHNDEQRSYNSALLKLREAIRKRILKRMNGFWIPGIKAERFITHYAKDDAVIIRVPNSVENSFFGAGSDSLEIQKKKEELGNADGQKVLFTPARLVEVKGIIPFCEVLKNVPKEKYVWAIAGDGPLKEEIQRKCQEYGLNILLLGMKKPEEVKVYYQAADVFLLPSISDASPLTCVEALWCGLPLFVSENVGNGPEVVREGENGYIFSYSDISEATKLIREMLSESDEWYRSAQAVSLEIAKQSFDQKVIAANAIADTVAQIGDMKKVFE